MNDYGAYLKQNSDAITAIAPTIWHLAHDGISLTADDAIMAQTAKLKKQSGVRVIPTVFDNESYNQGTLKPRLLKLFANPHKFIASIVNATLVRTTPQHTTPPRCQPLASSLAGWPVLRPASTCSTSWIQVHSGPRHLRLAAVLVVDTSCLLAGIWLRWGTLTPRSFSLSPSSLSPSSLLSPLLYASPTHSRESHTQSMQ